MFNLKVLRGSGIALCVLVSGCATVGPDFEKPEADVADSWLEAHDPRVDTSSSAYQSWWEVFNDPVGALIAGLLAINQSHQRFFVRASEKHAIRGFTFAISVA